MERAAQPAILEPTEREIRAAMRAVAVDQAITPLRVAKQHQILAEQFYGFDGTWPLHLVDQRRRLPVHPHQFPARLARPGPGNQVVLLLAHHGGGPFRTQVYLKPAASASLVAGTQCSA